MKFFEKLQNIFFSLGLRKGYPVQMRINYCSVPIMHRFNYTIKPLLNTEIIKFLKDNNIEYNVILDNSFFLKAYVRAFNSKKSSNLEINKLISIYCSYIVFSLKKDATLFLILFGSSDDE